MCESIVLDGESDAAAGGGRLLTQLDEGERSKLLDELDAILDSRSSDSEISETQ